MKIVFSRKGKAISLYEIENFYQSNKDKNIICISDEVILNRFRVGVKYKDIKPFTLIVKDFDKSLYNEECNIEGNFCYIWNAKIFNLNTNLILDLI